MKIGILTQPLHSNYGGDCDGRLVRDPERALRSLKGQGKDEADGNPVHLLLHPHGKRGSAGGQDRTKVELGGCPTRKLAANEKFLWGNGILAMKNRQKSGRNDRKQI